MSSVPTPRRRAVGQPVRRQALRTRLRGLAGPAVLLSWLVALGAVTLAAYVHQVGADQPFRQPLPGPAADVGRAVGQWLVVAATAAMLLVVPACTATILAGERQAHTAHAWATSFVRPRRVVTGHLTAAVSFVLLLVVVALPFLGFAWGLGGVAAASLGAGLGGVAVVGVTTACVSLAVSAWCRRALSAVLVTMLLLALVVGGSAVRHSARDGSARGHRVDPVLLANPVVLVAEAAHDASRPTRRSEAVATRAADAPVDHLAHLLHRGTQTAGPFPAAWPAGLGGALLICAASLVVAGLGVRRTRPD